MSDNNITWRETPAIYAQKMSLSAYLPWSLRDSHQEQAEAFLNSGDHDSARELMDAMKPIIEEVKAMAATIEAQEGVDYKEARKRALMAWEDSHQPQEHAILAPTYPEPTAQLDKIAERAKRLLGIA